MVNYGKSPFLECSSRGDKRFSAFYALVNGLSIEEQYQAAKIFEDGSTKLHWREAKGRRAVNAADCAYLYEQLWRQYILEHPDLIDVLKKASGVSDMFAKDGGVNQAQTLWKIRNEQLSIEERLSNMSTYIKLSASKVDTFFGCQRLYKYRYVDKLPVPVENKYFLIGNIAHTACELFHKSTRPVINSAKLMGDCFRQSVAKHRAFQKVSSKVITQDDLRSIKEMLSNYLSYIKPGLECNPICLEKFFSFDLDGITVTGKADRVDELKDKYVVIDYKTSKSGVKKDELESVQLPTYALWIRSEYKNLPIVGQYIYFRSLPKGVHEHIITNGMVDSAIEKYKIVADALKNNCSFKKSTKYKYCRMCEFKKECLTEG